MELSQRILNFYEFIYKMGWTGSIAWFDNHFHVVILGSDNRNVYSYGEEPTLTAALDSCLEGLRKAGF